MRELSVFVDESGNSGHDSKYYLLTLVFHDQDDSLAPLIASYEQTLSQRGLRNIPLHLNPLMRANGDYTNFDVAARRHMLTCFSTFANKGPFTYHVFSYTKAHFAQDGDLFARMKRDLVNYLFDNLGFFQSFDQDKIYYDNGQAEVTRVLHSAFEYVLGVQVVIYKDGRPADYRLQQVADYACGIELAALKYANGEQAAAEKIFFGTWRDFNKGFLKKIRKHLL